MEAKKAVWGQWQSSRRGSWGVPLRMRQREGMKFRMSFKSIARGSVDRLVVRDEKMRGGKNNSGDVELSRWKKGIVIY